MIKIIKNKEVKMKTYDPEKIMNEICRGEPFARLKSNNNYVYLCRNEIIKFPKASNRDSTIIEEADICEELFKMGLPVPRVVNVTSIQNTPVIFYEKFNGETIDNTSSNPAHLGRAMVCVKF